MTLNRPKSNAPEPKPICEHPNVGRPEFDYEEAKAKKMDAYQVQQKWPRKQEWCLDCGKRVIRYASPEHYIMGDW